MIGDPRKNSCTVAKGSNLADGDSMIAVPTLCLRDGAIQVVDLMTVERSFILSEFSKVCGNNVHRDDHWQPPSELQGRVDRSIIELLDYWYMKLQSQSIE